MEAHWADSQTLLSESHRAYSPTAPSCPKPCLSIWLHMASWSRLIIPGRHPYDFPCRCEGPPFLSKSIIVVPAHRSLLRRRSRELRRCAVRRETVNDQAAHHLVDEEAPLTVADDCIMRNERHRGPPVRLLTEGFRSSPILPSCS